MPSDKIVFVVDDDLEIRKSFQWLFESINLQVQAYPNARDFLDNYTNQPGCLIADVRMPLLSGLELLEQLKRSENKLPVIILTGYGEISMAIRALKAGAEDFLLKPVNHQILIETTQKCLNKATPDIISPNKYQELINSLTKREKQVMDLIVDGKLNKQIASILNVSISTVEVHRANVMKKMKTKSLAELVKIKLIYSGIINL